MHIKQSSVRDMTSGNVYKHLLSYSIPVFIGGLFQLLYNTVDTIIVGRYVSTEALAALGSSGMIINIIVYFFMGFSIGAGVLVGQRFGAKDKDALREAIQTTIAVAFILCVIVTVIGFFVSDPMLRLIHTPKDVFRDASVYLRIYFLGISGMLIYNIGGEILRAVGNTMLPLYFLILSSIVNIILDLFFVLVFDAGVAGVAWATVIAQLLSALLILLVLSKTNEVYRLCWRGIHINKSQLSVMLSIGMPSGLQSVITGFANLMAQSYVNMLGSACMAGWSCFIKLSNIAMLPTGAFAFAATNFVSQNTGAKDYARIKEGIFKSNLLNVGVSAIITVVMFMLAKPLINIYTDDAEVIRFGALFIHWTILSIIYYSFGNNLTGAMLATGDSKGPTIIKLIFYVGLRLAFLYVMFNYISASPIVVALAFPVSWGLGTITLYIYYATHWKRKFEKQLLTR